MCWEDVWFFFIVWQWNFFFFPRHFSFWVPFCNTTQRLLPLSVSSVSCCWENVCFFFIVWQVWNFFSHTISQNAKLFRGCCHCQLPLFHELLRKHVLFAMTQLTEGCCLLYFEKNFVGCFTRKRVPFLFIVSLSALQSMKLSKLTHKDFHKVLKVVVANVWKKTLNQTFKTKCTKFI